jgi:hypothetical protein
MTEKQEVPSQLLSPLAAAGGETSHTGKLRSPEDTLLQTLYIESQRSLLKYVEILCLRLY